MAAVSEPQDPTSTAAKLGSRVDEQLAQATSRIRAHDLAFGALVLVALVLVYATAMILLDRYLNLPQWVRQLGLLGFVGAFAGAAYLTIVSPLRKRINPLYAARQVENTIEDSKNSVTGYVDAQEKGSLNATVKAALASRAAKSVADADVNKAVDHRSLLYLGGVAIALFLTLVVLFFVFRPAQFGSLVRRTFAPFTTTVIKTRTEITLVKPEPADLTITDGQSITIAVHIAGKIPSADSPERVRLLVRHNPADPNYTELPLDRGDTARDCECASRTTSCRTGSGTRSRPATPRRPSTRSPSARSRCSPGPGGLRSPKYLRRPIEIVDSPSSAATAAPPYCSRRHQPRRPRRRHGRRAGRRGGQEHAGPDDPKRCTSGLPCRRAASISSPTPRRRRAERRPVPVHHHGSGRRRPARGDR
jgi:hypothetical protein